MAEGAHQAMNVRLMHPDRDFMPPQEMPRHERYRDMSRLPQASSPHEQALMQDLELETLLHAMAGKDEFLGDVARKALLSGLRNDMNTILYRQDVLKDCLRNPKVVRKLYGLAGEAIERKRGRWLGIFSRSSGGVLCEALHLLEMFVEILKKLRALADAHIEQFESAGFGTLLATLQEEFSDEYFAQIRNHMKALRFRDGVLVSAELGEANESVNHVLRQANHTAGHWLKRFFGKRSAAYTFRIHPRDEAGARILGDLRDRGINLVANALAQSTDHILGFFHVLRTELAFYIGCLNLSDKLAAIGAPMSFPRPEQMGTRKHRFSGLYDVSLALTMARSVAGNALDADGNNLVIITGANQGGKSTFLRSIGQAQLMMQCGMFVAAESLAAELCAGLYTHYERKEDATMKSGKLDEELGKMSGIADAITPHSMLLFNESFASTNEREGSEIARQIVSALLERRIKIHFVTHLYDFAHSLFDAKAEDTVFLRAERLADGTRTFRLVVGEPLETSYGKDLYGRIFAVGTEGQMQRNIRNCRGSDDAGQFERQP
jgi:DNA mismatch repair ATPase MutS